MASIEELWAKGCTFLGTSYAILGGAMTWVSERNLVSAISNEGAFGVLACGSMNPDQLGAEIQATQALTDKPFGVNLIILHPALGELIAVCIKNAVTHVVLAGGLPSLSAIKSLKEEEIKVIGFAPTLGIGKKLIKSGIDALIIEGMEAGGHIGAVSTSVLAQEILPHLKEVPIFVAGGIGRGEKIRSYLEMGAAGCQLGTRFVCATESTAHPRFKQAFINANARDAVVSVQLDARFPIIPVRALSNPGTQKFFELQQQVIQQFNEGLLDQKNAQLTLEHYWAGALRRAVVEGDIEYGSLMAGQSVGMVNKEQSVKEILQELYTQAQR
jgi:enoyl-[acyl-carrier protein] reductase II